LNRPAVAAVLQPLVAAGRIVMCGIIALELLVSARDHRDFVHQRAAMDSLPQLAMAQADFDRAIEVMEQLSRRGQHRAVKLPDLLIAAAAERAGVTVLHYDADYDLVAAATGQPMEWVVPRGSVP
jgi:predicted nucleic acid-binding protein